jgi:hypothetical protein
MPRKLTVSILQSTSLQRVSILEFCLRSTSHLAQSLLVQTIAFSIRPCLIYRCFTTTFWVRVTHPAEECFVHGFELGFASLFVECLRLTFSGCGCAFWRCRSK